MAETRLRAAQRVVVTGACGFIGTALSLRFLEEGAEVVGIDNLSRRGCELNLHELDTCDRFSLHRIDLADWQSVRHVFADIGTVDAIFHLAGQVAVTTSYQNRRLDFESNVQGSFNLLEAVESFVPDAYCLYASTNKVYGHLLVSSPVGTKQPPDPCTPYGVSKAAAEFYFAEYGREPIGLDTCCLRQSCIYGHHQIGTEDQGWLAWFAVANLLSLPISIYGDGNQIRDLLFIDDLVALYIECFERRLSGVYPVGGGAENAVSLIDAMALIRRATGRPFVEVAHEAPRFRDQPYFVTDLDWLEQCCLDWRPRTCVEEGLERMLRWLREHRPEIEHLHRRIRPSPEGKTT